MDKSKYSCENSNIFFWIRKVIVDLFSNGSPIEIDIEILEIDSENQMEDTRLTNDHKNWKFIRVITSPKFLPFRWKITRSELLK